MPSPLMTPCARIRSNPYQPVAGQFNGSALRFCNAGLGQAWRPWRLFRDFQHASFSFGGEQFFKRFSAEGVDDLIGGQPRPAGEGDSPSHVLK